MQRHHSVNQMSIDARSGPYTRRDSARSARGALPTCAVVQFDRRARSSAVWLARGQLQIGDGPRRVLELPQAMLVQIPQIARAQLARSSRCMRVARSGAERELGVSRPAARGPWAGKIFKRYAATCIGTYTEAKRRARPRARCRRNGCVSDDLSPCSRAGSESSSQGSSRRNAGPREHDAQACSIVAGRLFLRRNPGAPLRSRRRTHSRGHNLRVRS